MHTFADEEINKIANDIVNRLKLQDSQQLSENYFEENIKKIKGVIEVFYSLERTDNEDYPHIQDIFKYCGLEYDKKKIDKTIEFDLDEQQANYLGNYVLLHYYIKKYTLPYYVLNTYQLSKPSFITNLNSFCDIMLLEYFDHLYEENKHSWSKVVEVFEDIPISTKLGKHVYVYDETKVNDETKVDKSKILKLTTNNNDLSEYTSLKYLNFRGTKMIGASDTLECLRCYHSDFSEIPSNLINLKYLSCFENKLTEIPDTLINLKHLSCCGNDISEIPSSFIELKSLTCSNNPRLSKIPNTLVNLSCFQYNGTQIKEIPPELVKLLK